MRVTLYVWLPSRMLNIPSPHSALNILAKLSLGHAALRTYEGGPNGNGIYASYWPGNCRGWHQNLVNDESIHISVRRLLCLQYTSHNHSDPEAEETVLGQSNTRLFTFDLNHLNVESINEEFEKFRNGNYQWHILGSSIFRKTEMQTCSGLCYHLLEKGGMVLPKYLAADFCSDIGLVGAFIRVYTLSSKTRFHYVHILRSINTAVRLRLPYLRAVGSFADYFSEGTYLSLIKICIISTLLGYAELKFNKDDNIGKLISLPIILTILINLARYYLYEKTITPSDIANIADILTTAEKKGISPSQTYYNLPRFGLIKRSSINNTLSLLFAATELFFFIKSDSGPLWQAIEHSIFQYLAAKYCIYNTPFLIVSGMRGLYYFGRYGSYERSYGLLGTLGHVTANDCEKDRFLPLGIFLYYLPWIIDIAKRKWFDQNRRPENNPSDPTTPLNNPTLNLTFSNRRVGITCALLAGSVALGVFGFFKLRGTSTSIDSALTQSVDTISHKP